MTTQEALKLAVEALEPFEDDGIENTRDKCTLAIRAALAALRAVQDWQPMETALRDGTPVLMDNLTVKIWVDTSRKEEVLVSKKGNRSTYETRVVADGYWDNFYPEDDYSFTHWMPVPAPPRAEGGAE